MSCEESEEVKRREKGRHNGGIKNFFDLGRATRDVIRDEWILTQSIHDDIINRNMKLVSVDVDETGFFMTARFAKTDD